MASRMNSPPTGTHNRGLLSGFSPLAGVSAGTAGVLFAFGVLCLAWHQVSGHVSLAITVLVYVFIAGLAVVFGAFTWFAVLWVRYRARHPELLARRPVVRAEVLDAEPQAIAATARPAIEPPRVYLNVTQDQLAAIMRHHAAEEVTSYGMEDTDRNRAG